MRYYDNINKAEIWIIEKNLDSAIYYYESAFTVSSFSFGKDLFNAALCAQELDSFNFVKNYLIKIVKKGGGDFILGHPGFSKFHQSDQYPVFLREYISANKSFFDTYNLHLRAYSELLLELDQFYKRSRGTEKWSRDIEVQIDVEAFSILLNLIKKDSLPNEQLIGIKINKEINQISSFYLDVLFRHSYQYGNWGFTPYMKSLVNNGSIPPSSAIFHLDLDANERPFCTEPIWKINGEYYLSQFKPDLLKRCNQNRAKYYADSVGEHIKKILYKLENPNSPFLLSNAGGIAIINDLPEEGVKKLTKNMKKIN